MAYKYGISATVTPSIAEVPVATGTCVVYFGGAYASAKSNHPVKCTSYQDYLDKFHSGTEPAAHLDLDDAAETAFNRVGIDHAWFVNPSANPIKRSQTLVNDLTAALAPSLNYIVEHSSERPNVVCICSMTEYSGNVSGVPSALAALCDHGIEGRYSAFGVIDVDNSSDQLENGDVIVEDVNKFQPSGYLQQCYGWAITERDGSGDPSKAVNLAPVVAAMYARQDAVNGGGIPYRSIGNLSIPWALGMCVRVFEEGQVTGYAECNCRQSNMTDLAAKGIVSIVNKGNNTYATWGDHTSAFTDGGEFDELFRFDSSIRVFIHICNRFIDKWGSSIDAPMTLQQRNDVISEEQNYLNYLKAQGAVIGDPRCEFRAIDNPVDNLQQGYFTFVDVATTCIPIKHLGLKVTWTAEGLKSYNQ